MHINSLHICSYANLLPSKRQGSWLRETVTQNHNSNWKDVFLWRQPSPDSHCLSCVSEKRKNKKSRNTLKSAKVDRFPLAVSERLPLKQCTLVWLNTDHPRPRRTERRACLFVCWLVA